jgi:hypothetical protein
MPLKFIPGNNSASTQILKYGLLDPNANVDCRCRKEVPTVEKKNLLYPPGPNNIRIAQVLNTSLGGRIRFGNFGAPFIIDEIGRRAGQPGGMVGPLRNKF